MKKTSKLVFVASILIEYIGFVRMSPPETRIRERIDGIIKSPHDKRSYRGLQLSNKLKVMLINDPSTEKAAVSMVVAVGALHDFKGKDGLANLTGYMLTASYDFKQFLKDNGANSSDIQWTDADQQIFSFDINVDQLAPALTRFAQFFDRPPLDGESVQELSDYAVALCAVELDYQKCMQTDRYRMEEVEKLLSKKKHKFNHFFIGKLQTFRAGTLRNLVTFHRQWYSSNIMHLAVLGREDLDEQERLVTSLFENVPNRDAILLTFKYPDFHPWGPDQLRHKVYVVPIMEEHRLLRLRFPVPDYTDHYGSSPERYVSYLLTRSGPGSLISVLEKRKLCFNLYTHYSTPAGIGFYTITCHLTKYGETKVDDIADLIFQYLSLLLSQGVDKLIFNDLRRMKELDFWYKVPDETPLRHVHFISIGLRFYPLDEKFLSRIRDLLGSWDPTVITEFLSLYLTPESMNMTIVSQSFKKKAHQTEEHYNTKYGIEKIPNTLIDRWYQSETCDEFQVPLPNKFLPKILPLYPLPKNDNKFKYPYLVHKSSTTHVWLKQDEGNRIPKMHVWFEIAQPSGKRDSLTRAITNMYWACAKKKLKHYLHAAKEAGFEWDFTPTTGTMTIHSYGFSKTMPIFLEELSTHLKNTRTNISKDDFEDAKKYFIPAWEHQEKAELETQATWYSTPFFVNHEWSQQAMLFAFKFMRYRDVKKFALRLFSNVLIRAFVFGNCNHKVATVIANILEKQFKSRRQLLFQELLASRTIQMEYGRHFVYRLFKKGRHGYSYYTFYHFGLEPNRPTDRILGSLLAKTIGIWCTNFMQKSLPISNCAELDRNGTMGIAVMTRSTKSPAEVDLILERILRTTFRLLKRLKNEWLDEYKENFKKLMNDNKLSKPGLEYWLEILNHSYRFDKTEKELELVDLITLEDILTFFKEHLHPLAFRRSKLTVQVFPRGTSAKVIDEIPDEATLLQDIHTFQSGSTLLPENVRWSEIME